MVSRLVKHPHLPLTELKAALKWLGLTAKGEDVLKKCQLTQIDIFLGKKVYMCMYVCTGLQHAKVKFILYMEHCPKKV